MKHRRILQGALASMPAMLLLAGLPVHADPEPPAPTPDSARATSVLLLPALDVTADSAHMLAPRQAVIRHREQYEFISRQFTVLGESLANQAANSLPSLALANATTRTRENLDLLATRAGADWVVSVVVQDVKLDSPPGGEFTVHTHILLQVRDAKRHDWLLNLPYTGEATGAGSPIFVFLDSLDNAIKGSLASLLGAYPPVVTVLQEESLRDYLSGQTKPFVGDPQKPFSGLASN